MDYLYVCHFSNGHIKVGRSINPTARVAHHAERVGCMGVELLEHHIVECKGDIAQAELSLIDGCTSIASAKFKSEWFSGIDYSTACSLADLFAEGAQVVETFGDWALYVKQILRTGRTQTELAASIGVSQPAIAKIYSGKTSDVSFSVGYGLLQIGRSIGIEDPDCAKTRKVS